MHIHGGAAHLINVFLGVAAIGIVWRVIGSWLATRPNLLGKFGGAMLFAY